MDYDEIQERINKLSDKDLLKVRLSDYIPEVQLMYKEEIEKRNLSKKFQENKDENPSTTEIVETKKEIAEKIKDIPESEILDQFFKKNQLDEYIEKFKEQKVFSIELIKELTDNDLEKLGVAALGDRKRLIKLFQSNALDSFKNELLYSELTDLEKSKLAVKENDILKQNECSFKYGDSSEEPGKLTLYINRIEWKGDTNYFVISINKIIDVSVKSGAAVSRLCIKAYNKEYIFIMRNDEVTKNALLATFAGLSQLQVMGIAMMTDKPITDIEFWRQRIEELREYNKQNPNNFGIPNGEPQVKTTDSGIGLAIAIIIAISVMFFFYILNK